ncbi:MAG: peptidase [Coriobacteriia bacterium]|nr:peptidase [Coriobacteriia bacterium]
MPALIAHHLFGQAVLGGYALPKPFGDAETEAFLLGCQGPDPLFFAVFDLQLARIHRLGTVMHNTRVAKSFEAFRQLVIEAPAEHQKVLDAYLQGWLCHFTLDSEAHPFVIYYEREICSAGVPGLDQDARGEVHAQIESDLDASMLYRQTGRTIRTYRPMSEVNSVSNETVRIISQAYARVATLVFNLPIHNYSYYRSYYDMRLAYNLLYSPSGANRSLFGSFERLFRKHSKLQAISHRADVGEYSDFDNQENLMWRNPFTGETSSLSFDGIFDEAVTKAIWRLRLYASEASSTQLIGALNFLGSIVQ